MASGSSTATSSTTSRTMTWSRAGCCSSSTFRSDHGKQHARTEDDDAPGMCNGAALVEAGAAPPGRTQLLSRPFQTGGNVALLVSGIISRSCLPPLCLLSSA